MNITLIYQIRYSSKATLTKYLPGDVSYKGYLDEFMVFPLDHIIPFEITKVDDIKVLLIETTSPLYNTENHVKNAQEEITRLIEDKCNSMTIEVIEAPHESSKKTLGKIYRDICRSIVENSAVYADVTFGAKYLPIITFCALNYAEKYLNCEVRQLLYGLYNNNKNGFGEMIDFTTLYVLNTFGAIFDGSKTIFDSFCERLLK